ncbi:MAG: hypothetical protein IPL46_23815 [Saprospiraceae bacterium]|nr:hypothetical protein [Saprospiraceae bacterium]
MEFEIWNFPKKHQAPNDKHQGVTKIFWYLEFEFEISLKAPSTKLQAPRRDQDTFEFRIEFGISNQAPAAKIQAPKRGAKTLNLEFEIWNFPTALKHQITSTKT